MKISPGFVGSLVTGSRTWTLTFDEKSVAFVEPRQPVKTIALASITSVAVKPGSVWARLHIVGGGRQIFGDWVTNEKAKQFAVALKAAVGKALLNAVSGKARELGSLAHQAERLMAAPAYISHRDVEVWQSRFGGSGNNSAILAAIANPLFPVDGMDAAIRGQIDTLRQIVPGMGGELRARNRRFVAAEVLRHKTFFDSVEKDPLSEEQRVAAVVMEDRNLVVAAAGSGKTSTIVGKVGYALLTKRYAPEELLVLAFNRDAAIELEERLNRQLKPLLPAGQRLTVQTFHAFGLSVLGVAEGRKPSISKRAIGGEGDDSRLINDLVMEQMRCDLAFATLWITFRATCLKRLRDPVEFHSLEEWQRFVRTSGDYKSGRPGFLTINGEIVKSQGELAIANWLFLQGIEYEYERPYEYETADRTHRQYQPDFYLPQINTYVEHYALDRHGRPPAAFGKRYEESMQWKEALHQAKGTQLITTTFADFVSGQLFDNLQRQLEARGQQIAPRAPAEVMERLNAWQKVAVPPFIATFMKHAKANSVSPAELLERATASSSPYRAMLFARIAAKLIAAYNANLEKAGEIDFEDMILRAADSVDARRYTSPYKLILVDEFQDISQDRAKLLKALLRQRSDCKLFAVGDDWQAIYRFAGADIDLMTRFAEHFGSTETSFLTTTFRCNQGISDIAARFIQANPRQLKKVVKSCDPTVDGVIQVRRYAREEDQPRVVEAVLREVARDVVPAGKKISVYLLARYHAYEPTEMRTWQSTYSSLAIDFKTIHSSKGLQADIVVILGLQARWYAFPSEHADDPLLDLVMPAAESYPSAEERRLLYVAITRAKHRVYLLGSETLPSTFLAEVEGYAGQNHRMGPTVSRESRSDGVLSCPRCDGGRLRKRAGRNGAFLGCSNYPACRYTRDA